MSTTSSLRLTSTVFAVFAVFAAARVAGALDVAAPYDTDYTAVSLGSVPGVPTSYGGLTFKAGDPHTILIGGAANQAAGALYEIGVARDGENHITGFVGTAERYADAPYNDGGVTYGPGGVLFLARWPVNELGQLEPGSTTTDKVISLTPFEVSSSLSALAFVPAGYPGAGSLKMVTYSGGNWYDARVVSDGSGTWDLDDVAFQVQIPGGPEGFVYLPPGSPQFDDFSTILVAEYGAGTIAAYEIDDEGDPIVSTRQPFVTGLSGAEGAVVDPLTGDFLFSTFGGQNQVVAVRGFGIPTGCAGCATGAGCTDVCDEEVQQCRTCGHPFSNSRCVVNAVVVLQGALGLRECEACTCDVDSNEAVNASDALRILRSCAGVAANLDCPLPD
jgi:hypothetical protein